jgi:Flp pilus assembly protein TadG
MIRKFPRNTDGSVAIETAMFVPIFVAMMLGITDLGAGMFVKMTVNAAAQSGATHAVINSATGSPCASMTGTCLSSIQAAMNDAAGDPTFCTKAVCSTSLTSCADANGGRCFTITADYPYTPLLPDAVYTWASTQNYSSTVTVRIQ